MSYPEADVAAYDGSTVIKRTPYGKTKGVDPAEYNRVANACANLEAAIAKRLTFDSIDFGKSDIEDQMRINMGVATELRKEVAKFKTFMANNKLNVDF